MHRVLILHTAKLVRALPAFLSCFIVHLINRFTLWTYKRTIMRSVSMRILRILKFSNIHAWGQVRNHQSDYLKCPAQVKNHPSHYFQNIQGQVTNHPSQYLKCPAHGQKSPISIFEVSSTWAKIAHLNVLKQLKTPPAKRYRRPLPQFSTVVNSTIHNFSNNRIKFVLNIIPETSVCYKLMVMGKPANRVVWVSVWFSVWVSASISL